MNAAPHNQGGFLGSPKGFTLIELMVVVGIMGLILAMGAPTLYKFFHKEGFRKSVEDVMEACSTARSRAIMGQQTTVLVFLPSENNLTTQFRVESVGGGGWGGEVLNGQLPDDVAIEKIRVDGTDCMGLNWVRIRFFPNGTCDELELVLKNSAGERRRISLELTTSLASLDSDPNNWR
jgi:prepilin-type N-terminal cleavage/methylation domain-containing protein